MFHENPLLAENSHEISYLIFSKIRRVVTKFVFCCSRDWHLRDIGANFSLQLSSRTRFDKINKKKVIAENQCEKHKKSSLVFNIS